jgi:hypothetical protein
MARSNLSTRAIASALAHTTQDAFILLFAFTDPSDLTGNTVYRAANNTEDVVSNGKTFTASYFRFAFPDDDDDAPKGVTIQVDNVDQRMIGMLRAVTKPIPCVLQVVIAATPDVVEMELTDLRLAQVTWDAQYIQGQLQSDDPLNQVYPADIYEPRTFPGCF